ncbi:MAG: FMN-binding protein [Treponema sp.]|jgi:major membrane immunogen (membrane-anchored lipoprotein)|nr:FMN-binding protein [Treponema sp.]
MKKQFYFVQLKLNTVRAAAFLAAALCAALFLSACTRGLKDGVYEGKSGVDDTGAWGEITVTVRDGKAAACVFITRQKDGTVKDEDYGKINGEISNQVYYDKAQLAVWAMEAYAMQYAEHGDLDRVEAVSGATIAYNQFLEAASEALEKAKK